MADAAKVADRAKQCDGMVSSQQYLQALKCAIDDPPKDVKDSKVKAANANNAVSVLSVVPLAQIDTVLKAMSTGEHDEVMKYVYKGFLTGEHCSNFLKWHEALVKIGGHGVVMRAMVDRKV
jgi:hypothetical protein